MSFWELFLIGFEGLLVHKIRSILSILGIIFGVASVVAVLAVVGGARKEVLKKMEALGTNNIIVKRQDFEEKIEKQKEIRRITNGLAIKDAEMLKKELKNIQVIAPFIKTRTNILINDFPDQVDVFGITPDYMKTINFSLKSGRHISDFDNFNANKVCVVEENIINNKGKPIGLGEFITIDQEFFMIVGILKSKDLKDESSEIKDIQSINKRIYISLNSSTRFISRSLLDPEIDGIVLKVEDVNSLKEIALAVDMLLMKAHHLDPKLKEKDYEVNIAVDLVQNFESTQNIFNWVLGCSAGISLLVGGIGIMNIMLANVTGMNPARHQAGEMGHVHHQIRAHFICDFTEPLEVPDAAIGGAAGDDQLRLVLAGLGGDGVHVQKLVLAPHAIGHRLEPFAAHVDGRAMGQMPARRQIQPHESIARIEQRQKHRLVHLAAGIGLDIGKARAEQRLGPFDGQGFDHIGIFAAAVIALARIAFGIFVGQHRALGFQHRFGNDVLAGDQFDLVALAVQFVLDRRRHIRVRRRQPLREETVIAFRGIGQG